MKKNYDIQLYFEEYEEFRKTLKNDIVSSFKYVDVQPYFIKMYQRIS